MKRIKATFILFIFFISVSARAEKDYPQRIISLSPSITEIIYALSAFDRLVGVSLYTDFPPEAESLPTVGGWINPSMEAILKLNPDLVILLEDQRKIFGDKLTKLGINLLSVDSNPSIDHITNTIIEIGTSIGENERAIKLRDKIDTDIRYIKSMTKGVNDKKVLCVIGRNPGTLNDIYVIGNSSYINELITLAGGKNVIGNKRLSVKITKEAIFSLDPDIIIEVNHDRSLNKEDILNVWKSYYEIRAVKNDKVYIISSTNLLHPSQRVVAALKELLSIIQPEVYAEL